MNSDIRSAALRHAVFGQVIDLLPAASSEQLSTFAANLSIELTDRNIDRFLNLRVTPDLAETGRRGASVREIERIINNRAGDRLADVAGFYQMKAGGRWRLNMPIKCVLYGYRSEAGFYNGILCQPIDRLDSYFLLSAAKFGGCKALRLTGRDQIAFSQFEGAAN